MSSHVHVSIVKFSSCLENLSSFYDIFRFLAGLFEVLNFEIQTLVCVAFALEKTRHSGRSPVASLRMMAASSPNCRSWPLCSNSDIQLPWAASRSQRASELFCFCHSIYSDTFRQDVSLCWVKRWKFKVFFPFCWLYVFGDLRNKFLLSEVSDLASW